MSDGRMHHDELLTDPGLVRRLVAAQFPQWAELPVRRVGRSSTNNAIYRLGDDLAVRLPRLELAVAQVEFEYEWLPRLAPHSPVAVPEPVALGVPGEGYPWPWAVNRWVDGDTVGDADGDRRGLAADLGAFVVAIQKIEPTGGRPGYRTGPLWARDAWVREWTAAARGLIDTEALLDAWEEALAAPEWAGPPLWAHGDLLPGNVLVRAGRLSGVIDFGAAGVGDPACDAMAAWTLLGPGTREVFRTAAGFDDATWARGKGWVLVGVSGLTYYRETNPAMAALARRSIDGVLADRVG